MSGSPRDRADCSGCPLAASCTTLGEPERPIGHVRTVFEDRDGNLWIGTDRGVERWRDPVFTTHATAQGLPEGAVGPVYADEFGRVGSGRRAAGCTGSATASSFASLAVVFQATWSIRSMAAMAKCGSGGSGAA